MDTIDLLNLVPAIAIPGIDFALREVGSTGEDSDPMSPAHPVTGMFIDLLAGALRSGGKLSVRKRICMPTSLGY